MLTLALNCSLLHFSKKKKYHHGVDLAQYFSENVFREHIMQILLLYHHYCFDFIAITHSFAFFLHVLVVFFPYCNERPCLNLSTSRHMQRIEREMRCFGTRRRTSVPSLSSRILHRERGEPFCLRFANRNIFSPIYWDSPLTLLNLLVDSTVSLSFFAFRSVI